MDKQAIVITTIGTLKVKPDFTSETADETLFGKLVNIIEESESGWYLIETDYRYKGYMHKEQLLIDTDAAQLWDKEANNIIIWGTVDVMKEPKFQSYQIQLLTRGAVIKLTEESNENWIRIQLPNGEYGWIRKDFVGERIRTYQIEDEEELRNNVIKLAKEYLGTQYRWGGKSPLGIDCSGLASISYLLNGVVIYRDAHIIEGFLIKEIEKDKLNIGDLLFWPGHVALYMGNDEYIHSTGASSGVVINSLNPLHSNYRKDLEKVEKFGSIF